MTQNTKTQQHTVCKKFHVTLKKYTDTKNQGMEKYIPFK